MWLQILWVLSLVQYCLGAKRELFKTCEQSGFCYRNTHYSPIDNIYHINSIHLDGDSIKGQIKKSLPNHEILLPFELGLLDGGIHFVLDENRPETKINSTRFSPSSLYNIQHIDIGFKSIAESHKISFDNIEVILYNEFKIEIFIDKSLALTINQDSLLNLEHYRTETDVDQLVEGESDFNMFQDNFKDSIRDTIPLGPESVGVDFTFHQHNHLYGIPEHSDSLELKDQMYRLFNVDIFEYEINSTLPMYGSIPFLLGVNSQSSIGLFWINSADTYIDISTKDNQRKTHWMSENGKLEFVILIGKTPSEVNKKYGLITGFTTLPQLFSLGYHQCRWNYNDDKDLIQVINEFDNYEIPVDTIWLDIEYTDAKKYFTWNNNFHPQSLLPVLDHEGRNLVVIIDPHIKTDYEISDHLIKNKLTIMNNKNDPFKGHCWPGESVWVDGFNPNCQEYWDNLHKLDYEGFLTNNTNIHLWNDMNEISVFDGPETSSPRDNLHYGMIEDRSVHNLNGLKFHDLTYKSLVKRLQTTQRQRPFILTRSFFAGSQTTAAMWTGDNMSKWEYLKISIPMVLNNGLTGMPFAGADVGGFFGDPTEELLTRWYQTGIFYPFFRAHAHIDSRRREPWVPGEPYTSIIRDAIRLRYKLLPEFYNAFKQSSESGVPILKPMFYDSSSLYDVEDQFFLGDSGILVKPVTQEDSVPVVIRIPDSNVYYDFTNGIASGKSKKNTDTITIATTLETIPMVLKGGHIISTKERYRRSTKLMINDPYTITVALDTNGQAHGSLYIDDGESIGYLDGEYTTIKFSAHTSGSVIDIKSEVVHNGLGSFKVDKVIILGVENVRDIKLDGELVDGKSSKGKVVVKVNREFGWDLKVEEQLAKDEL